MSLKYELSSVTQRQIVVSLNSRLESNKDEEKAVGYRVVVGLLA